MSTVVVKCDAGWKDGHYKVAAVFFDSMGYQVVASKTGECKLSNIAELIAIEFAVEEISKHITHHTKEIYVHTDSQSSYDMFIKALPRVFGNSRENKRIAYEMVAKIKAMVPGVAIRVKYVPRREVKEADRIGNMRGGPKSTHNHQKPKKRPENTKPNVKGGYAKNLLARINSAWNID